MTDDTTTDIDRRTEIDRILRGGTLVGATMLAVDAATPVFESLPAHNAEMLGLAVMLVIAYGIQLVVTSEYAYRGIERALGALGVAER